MGEGVDPASSAPDLFHDSLERIVDNQTRNY